WSSVTLSSPRVASYSDPQLLQDPLQISVFGSLPVLTSRIGSPRPRLYHNGMLTFGGCDLFEQLSFGFRSERLGCLATSNQDVMDDAFEERALLNLPLVFQDHLQVIAVAINQLFETKLVLRTATRAVFNAVLAEGAPLGRPH